MDFLKLKLPPPLTFLIFAAAMWLISMQTSEHIQRPLIVITLLLLLATLLSICSLAAFFKAKTTISPLHLHHTRQLITQGVYAYSRNPMYLAILIVLIAWGLFLQNLLTLVLLPLFILCVNYLQIIPEEQALTSQFGQQFTQYCQKVRRWL